MIPSRDRSFSGQHSMSIGLHWGARRSSIWRLSSPSLWPFIRSISMIYSVEKKGYSITIRRSWNRGGGRGWDEQETERTYESDIMYYLLMRKVGDNHI